MNLWSSQRPGWRLPNSDRNAVGLYAGRITTPSLGMLCSIGSSIVTPTPQCRSISRCGVGAIHSAKETSM